MNSITNCFCYQNAVSDKINEQLFQPIIDDSLSNNFGGISINNKKSDLSIPVNLFSLDDKFNNLNSLRILKLDVVGMDLKVLVGGYNIIKRTKPFIFRE